MFNRFSVMRVSLIIFALTVISVTAGCYDSSDGDAHYIRFPVNDINEIATRSGVEIDRQVTSDGNGSLAVDTNEPVTVGLFNLRENDFDNMRLVYRARLRTEDVKASGDARGIAYIELKALFPDGEELVSRGPRVPPSGTTNWTTAETILYVDKGGNPEQVELNLVVDGSGKAWIDDVVLESRPLRIDYLFWGHAVVWIVLIIYIYNLLTKQKRLRKELTSVKSGS